MERNSLRGRTLMPIGSKAAPPRAAASRVLAELSRKLAAAPPAAVRRSAAAEGGQLLQWEHAVSKAEAERKTKRGKPISEARAISEVNAARKLLGLKIKRSKAQPGDARLARGQKISYLMKERGMELGEASRYLAQQQQLL